MNKRYGAKTACVYLVLVLALLLSSCGSGYSWGKGVTEGIPLPQDIKAVAVSGDDTSAAAYFENVTSDDIGAYAALLESECGITFSGDSFPRSAIYGERIIVLHYNVTEMKFSVTVAAKANNENLTSGDKK